MIALFFILFPFSLTIDLYFFINVVIRRIFNPTAVPEIVLGIPTKESKAGIEAP